MNKIYKVVWSKVKHCYVVTSELAKRQTKGCGTRSLRMATVSLGVAASLLCTGAVLPIFGESVAEASELTVTGCTGTNFTPTGSIIGSTSEYVYYPKDTGVTVLNLNGSWSFGLDIAGHYVNESGVNASGYTVNLNGPELFNNNSNCALYGARVRGGGNATANHVTIITGTVKGIVAGGCSTDGSANSNSVEIQGGTFSTTTSAYSSLGIAGGVSSADASGNANNNTVEIKGGNIGTNVDGGLFDSFFASGNANGNTVTISGGTITGEVKGGAAGGTGIATGNNVNLNGGKVGNGYDAAYGGWAVKGNAENNHVNINGGTANGSVYGGQSKSSNSASADVIGNTITITKGTVTGYNNQWIYGGYTWGKQSGNNASGKAEDNTVTISGGTLSHDTSAADVSGGVSNGGDAIHNIVKIENTFTDKLSSVTGGEADKNATKNEVTISGGTVSVVRGGYSANGGIVGGDNADDGNKVFINGGTVGSGVQGGFSTGSGSTGMVKNNTVKITKGTVNGIIYGGYGWSSSRSASDKIGDVSYNKVEISGGTVSSVYGGQNSSGMPEQSGKAEENTVSVSGDAELTAGIIGGNSVTIATNNHVSISGSSKVSGIVRGGYSSNSRTDYASAASAKRNDVTISDNAELSKSVYGGYSNVGTAESNVVTIKGGTINVDSSYDFITGMTGNGVYGGFSRGSGNVLKNTVTIEGGTVNAYRGVYGGWAKNGTAGGSSADDGNKVNISGGTVSGDVYGGYGESGNPTKNSVIISGGTFNGQGSDQLIGRQAIFGGYNHNGGSASDNTVTISGGTFIGSKGILIQGGRTYYETGTTNNNTVNLTGTVTGLDKGSLLGGGSNASNTGNELHVGGIKGGDNGVWQGKTGDTVNNKVAYVANFDKVVLHSVKWDTKVAALEATTVEKVKTLDIQSLSFDKTPSSGESMMLLKSSSDLSTIKLDHKNGKGVEITKSGVDLGSSEKTEAAGENGVKLTQTVTEKVTLAEDCKAINYAMDATKKVTAITLDKVKDPRNMTGTGYDFSGVTKIDASKLELDITPSLDMTSAIVPLVTNADNIKVGVAVDYGTGKTNHTQDFSVTHDATGINVGTTVEGIVAAVPGTSAGTVNYVATGATMNSVDLSNWNGKAVTEDMSKVKGKTGGVAVVTGEFALPALSSGSVDIISTNTENFFGTVTGKRQYGDMPFENDEANGVILSGKQSGGVKAEDRGKKLTYYAMKNTAETMTFGKVEFKKGGVARDLKNAYTFNASSTIDATDLTFKETTEALQENDSMTLAANAKGITSANKPTQPTNPNIAIAYTDKQGIKFGATAVGTVAAVTDAVQYTVDSVTLNSIDLAGWSGTASSVPTGWSLKDGATVETDGMTAPKVEAGKSASIITSGTDNFFANAKINGANKYQETDFSEEDSGITFAGKQAKGVKADGKNLVYALGGKNVTAATMTGEIKWDTEKAYYTNTKYAFTDSAKTDISAVKFTATADPLNQSMTLIKNNVAGTVTEGTPEFTVNLSNTSLSATAKGETKVAEGNLTYTVTGVELQSVTVNGVGSASDTVPSNWTTASGLTVDTSKMELPGVMPSAGEETVILKGSDKITFSDDSISDDNKYGKNPDRFTEEDKTQGTVVIAGKQDKGVAASKDGKSLVYKVGTKDVSSVSLGTVTWASGSTLLDASEKACNFAGVTALAGSFAMNYEKPEDVAAKQSMTLLKANETLKDIAKEETNLHKYTNEPVAGVTMQGEITGKLSKSGNNVVFTATENKATDLTFGKVEWKADGALIDHSKTLTNVSFDGATVDTSNIDFYKEMYIEADQTMTLVSDFGGEAKVTPESTKYMVGTAYEGESETKMEGNNLIIRTTTAAGLSEQTHKTVMAMEAGVALLAGGSEHVGKALESLGDAANQGPDGTSVGVSIGGSGNRYETGSHVNVNAWNAALAVGAKRELKQGALEYGVFGEYGKGSYKLYNNDGGRGDGDAHYAGAGLMAKWTNKHDVYTEASFRLGRMSDSADNILEGGGNKYGYDVHANYYGAHVGIGKVFRYKGGKSLDVYGKYFYTKRDGVEYDAKQHYNLDSVASSVLRIGARYGSTDKLWNWYGGLAYEYEFDGEAKGTVNGTEIRAASIKGSSVRGELGMKMSATKDNPWQADISIYGYGGKHRGFGGNVNVAYTF